MNIRFADNAVRVRLSAADVESLNVSGAARCSVQLPPGVEWSCAVHATDAPAPSVSCQANASGVQVEVVVPRVELARWQMVAGRARTIRVTVASPNETVASLPLTLIIEQDLHPKTERS